VSSDHLLYRTMSLLERYPAAPYGLRPVHALAIGGDLQGRSSLGNMLVPTAVGFQSGSYILMYVN
jgi:hypothetical protein